MLRGQGSPHQVDLDQLLDGADQEIGLDRGQVVVGQVEVPQTGSLTQRGAESGCLDAGEAAVPQSHLG